MKHHFFILILLLGLFYPTTVIESKTIVRNGVLCESDTLQKSTRSVSETGNGVSVTYTVSDVALNRVGSTGISRVSVPGFHKTYSPEAPEIAVRYDSFEVPSGYNAEVRVISREFTDFTCTIPQAHAMVSENEVDTVPIVAATSRGFYPESNATAVHTSNYRGIDILYVAVNPLQYDSATNTLRICKSLTYEVIFSPVSEISTLGLEEPVYVDRKFLRNTLTYSLPEVMPLSSGDDSEYVPIYLIITSPDLYNAANKLAEWRKITGHRVIIKKTSNPDASAIKQVINNYRESLQNIDYVLILGDYSRINSAFLLRTYNETGPNFNAYYPSDFGLVMNSSSDVIPDIMYGRIPATSLTEAEGVVDKIIEYEKNPPLNSQFYKNVALVGNFEDKLTNDGEYVADGYEDRRFILTSEEIFEYLSDFNKSCNRLYYAYPDVNPRNWNNDEYSDGGAIPNYLRRPNFSWNANSSGISKAFNDGSFLINYRGHGEPGYWKEPYFHINNAKNLVNGDLQSVVLSITCNTGQFANIIQGASNEDTTKEASDCLAWNFLKNTNGGAVGVLASSTTANTGANDIFDKALINCIWPDPGLDIGLLDITYPSYPLTEKSSRIAGEIIRNAYGLVNQKYLSLSYSFNLRNDIIAKYHWFGDPAMRITTSMPTPIYGCNVNKDTALKTITISAPSNAVISIYDANLISNKVIRGKGTLTYYYGTGDVNKVYYSIVADDCKPVIYDGTELPGTETTPKIESCNTQGKNINITFTPSTHQIVFTLNQTSGSSGWSYPCNSLTGALTINTSGMPSGYYVLTMYVDGAPADSRTVPVNMLIFQ